MVVAVSYDNDNFDNGYTQGQEQAKSFWMHNFNSNCEDIEQYDEMIGYYIRDTYDNSHYSKTSHQYSFNEGAAKGMKQQQAYYDNQCKNYKPKNDYDYVDVDDCKEIGLDSASSIAVDWSVKNCNYPSSGSGRNGSSNYFKYGNKEECLTIAKDDCIGNMDVKIEKYCEAKKNDFNLLKKLKNKCYSHVKDKIYNDVEGKIME